MSDRLQYYDPDGNPLTSEQWIEMFETRKDDTTDDSWWRRRTDISPDISVSTVWLGLDHRFMGDGPPLFWETMIFGGDCDQDMWRHSSKEEAFESHERIVKALQAGKDLNEQ